MSNKDEEFKNALAGKTIPILTLDNKWHKLLGQTEKTSEINRLESKMNELIKRQGKLNTESKDIKKIKKKLMQEVMIIADRLLQDPDNKKMGKDREEHKRLLEECNEKLDAYEEEMLELPREIDRINRELMFASMKIFYKKIQDNAKELNEINDWIKKVRRELKKKMVRKEEKEAANHKMYSYMHDIFGADVIEVFDRKYNPDNLKKEENNENEKKIEENKVDHDAPES
ncbi:MAG: hypothetical protein J1F41_04375 [Lachnospiraceae bacterium]|nr:hypothetical protein [Lachnospiraceae bacterium]